MFWDVNKLKEKEQKILDTSLKLFVERDFTEHPLQKLLKPPE
jgi:hypothetical protein